MKQLNPFVKFRMFLPSSEYSEGQTSNAYNRLHENYIYWEMTHRVLILF